jgi:hypothetical protein
MRENAVSFTYRRPDPVAPDQLAELHIASTTKPSDGRP